MGRARIDYPAILSPSLNEIFFAAAYYEGEGCPQLDKVTIVQNDRERLDWLCARFGGKVYGPSKSSSGNKYYQWVLVRERALGFLFTIFPLLNRARKEQIKQVLRGEGSKQKYERYDSLDLGLKDEPNNDWSFNSIKL